MVVGVFYCLNSSAGQSASLVMRMSGVRIPQEAQIILIKNNTIPKIIRYICINLKILIKWKKTTSNLNEDYVLVLVSLLLDLLFGRCRHVRQDNTLIVMHIVNNQHNKTTVQFKRGYMYQGLARNTCNVSEVGSIPTSSTK